MRAEELRRGQVAPVSLAIVQSGSPRRQQRRREVVAIVPKRRLASAIAPSLSCTWEILGKSKVPVLAGTALGVKAARMIFANAMAGQLAAVRQSTAEAVKGY